MIKNKKILITLDLNCLIGYVAPIKNFAFENTSYPDLMPYKVQEGYNIWTRPNSDILIKYLFFDKKAEYDVGVWATQTKEQTAFQINNFLGSLKYSLSFVLFSKPPEGKNDILPFATKRDLKIIFDKHPQYTAENTLCLTNFKNEITDYKDNDLILPLYHPSLGYSSFDLDAHMYYMFEYLNVVNSMRQKDKVNDIRELMKQVNYNQMVKVRSATSKPDKFKWDPSNFVRF